VERKYEPATVDSVIAYYEEKGDLDDARFSEVFVSHQLKTRPDGPRRIATQLRQLGVADNLIQAALDKVDATDTGRQTERARQFIERRLRRLSDADRASAVQTHRRPPGAGLNASMRRLARCSARTG
jgi:SOS response regulatory protein OraA/RecX